MVTVFIFVWFALGLALVVGLMVRSAREDQMPSPLTTYTYPIHHVRPVAVGTCAECGKKDVRVHRHRFHPLLDLEDVCDSCLSALAHEPGLAGGGA